MLAKTKLNTLELLIFKALIGSNIGHDKFISIRVILKKYEDMKEKSKESW